MCRAIDCEVCGLRTWVGCGLHIENALYGVPLEDRCSGWKTGQCSDAEIIDIDKDTVPMSEVIEQHLRKRFDGDIHFLEVNDVSGGSGSKFSVVIVLSKGFDGVKLLDRHRMINGKDGAISTIMENIHALELKTWTKNQYDTKQTEK